MNYRSSDIRILRPIEYEFVLSIGVFLLAAMPNCAEEFLPDEADLQPVTVLTQSVQSDAAKTVRRYPARVGAVEQVEIISRLSADIEEIGFTEGGVVRKGQLLYRLDDTRFIAAVSNQAAQVAETKAKLELATLTFDRKQRLAEKGMAPRADFDAARAAKLELEANLDAANAALALARDDLRHTRIVSPTDGRIGLTAKTAGNYVTPETGILATIIRTDPLRIRFSLSMTDYARLFGWNEERLKSDAEIYVETPDGVEPLPKGTVEFVDTKAVKQTDTVLVYVRQPNPDGRLVPDSAATLVLSVSTKGYMPWAPPQSIIEDGTENFVYVVEDGKATLRSIEVGVRLPERVFVKSGLDVGETIIVGGMHKVTDGSAVCCKEAK